MGGGKGGVPSLKPGPLEKEQAAFLKQQRHDVIEPIQAAGIPAAMPGFVQAFQTSLAAPDRQAIEGQFKQSMNDVMAGAGGRGGMLRRAMTDVSRARAETVANAVNQARQLGISRSLGLLGPAGFPGASTVINAGNQAAATEAQRRFQNAQMQAQAGSSKGGFAGGLMGLGSMFR